MEVLMDKQELLDLGNEFQGVRIDCLEGQLWITQCGDNRDHILRNGGSFMVRSKGRVIVTASQSSRLTFSQGKESDRLRRNENLSCRTRKVRQKRSWAWLSLNVASCPTND